jgi:hypothetical protein
MLTRVPVLARLRMTPQLTIWPMMPGWRERQARQRSSNSLSPLSNPTFRKSWFALLRPVHRAPFAVGAHAIYGMRRGRPVWRQVKQYPNRLSINPLRRNANR